MIFEQIYNEFFKVIYSYIMLRVRSDATAQDIASSVWQKVLKNLDSYDENKGNIRQWLFAVARNEINMHHRLYYVRNFFSLTGFEDAHGDGQKGIDQTLTEEEEKQALLAAMGKLNAKERDIIALKFYSGLNNIQISQVAGISESNAGTIINRSINKLRVFLEAK